ncbi:uncharacterized protein IAS62_000800 [Cryptococcus decagattii]|uniref:Uncharacterized protein n=1 Tax=Cryptococcus decagattii TaxID=1859122 RepID=A0ABZ2ANM6_9TREE
MGEKSKVLKMNHLMGPRAPILIALKTFTHLIRAAWQKVRQQEDATDSSSRPDAPFPDRRINPIILPISNPAPSLQELDFRGKLLSRPPSGM